MLRYETLTYCQLELDPFCHLQPTASEVTKRASESEEVRLYFDFTLLQQLFHLHHALTFNPHTRHVKLFVTRGGNCCQFKGQRSQCAGEGELLLV